MSQQTAKMLVEAGIIPKNAIQQLAHYRLLPEDYEQLHGSRPLDTSDKSKVDTFVKDLGKAITDDMAAIRETELDHPGGYKNIFLEFDNPTFDGEDDVLIDRLGRLVVPNEMPWSILRKVDFRDGVGARMVVRKEPRYEGDRIVALVMYVESPNDKKAGD